MMRVLVFHFFAFSKFHDTIREFYLLEVPIPTFFANPTYFLNFCHLLQFFPWILIFFCLNSNIFFYQIQYIFMNFDINARVLCMNSDIFFIKSSSSSNIFLMNTIIFFLNSNNSSNIFHEIHRQLSTFLHVLRHFSRFKLYKKKNKRHNMFL